MRVGLSRPDIGQREIELVTQVLRSSHLALGPRLTEFEEVIASYMGAEHAVAVNSGTSGLHLAVRAHGIAAGDEVITTPFSFVASSNAILYEGAKPIFVDVEERTGNIAPAALAEAVGPATRAVLPVDVFGHPARLDEIRRLSAEHNLIVIEDACEALGAEWLGTRTGSPKWCDTAIFAFYPNKQITTGEGGVIVTDDAEIAALCRSMRNQGRREPELIADSYQADEPGTEGLWLQHDRLGFNYRMHELSAALGIAQLERISEILERRMHVASLYRQRLESTEGVRLPLVEPSVTRMSWFVYVIRVGYESPDPQRQAAVRATVMRQLVGAGVQCRPYFTPIHLQPFYRETFGYSGGEFPVAEQLGRTSIAIPFHNHLTEAEVDYVGDQIELGIRRVAKERG